MLPDGGGRHGPTDADREDVPLLLQVPERHPRAGRGRHLDVVLLSGGGGGRGLGIRRGILRDVAPPLDQDYADDGEAEVANADEVVVVGAKLARDDDVDDLWLAAVLDSADDTARRWSSQRGCTWIARNIEQRFPTMRQLPEGAAAVHSSAAGGLHQAWSGAGTHELFLESPRHNASFGHAMSLAEVYAVLLLWTRRYRALRKAGKLPFAMIFKNSGEEAGATQQHPHSQLIGFPVVPNHTKTTLACARTFHEVNGSCVFCRMAKCLRAPSADRASGRELVVYQNDRFVAFCPWAPPCDYCIYIMPWKHTADFFLEAGAGTLHAADGTAPPDTSTTALAALADVLRAVSRKLYRYCGNPDYNLVVRNPPFSSSTAPWYHWHIEVAPIFAKKGGLEYGTHCMVIMTPPEVAAKHLRETNVDDDDDLPKDNNADPRRDS